MYNNICVTLTETLILYRFFERKPVPATRQIFAHNYRVISVQIQFLVPGNDTISTPSVNGSHSLATGPTKVYYDF